MSAFEARSEAALKREDAHLAELRPKLEALRLENAQLQHAAGTLEQIREERARLISEVDRLHLALNREQEAPLHLTAQLEECQRALQAATAQKALPEPQPLVAPLVVAATCS